MSGYSLAVGVDHGGDDISCSNGQSISQLAGSCSADASCRAFNVYNNQQSGCTKRAAGPVDTSNVQCFYTKTGGGGGGCTVMTFVPVLPGSPVTDAVRHF